MVDRKPLRHGRTHRVPDHDDRVETKRIEEGKEVAGHAGWCIAGTSRARPSVTTPRDGEDPKRRGQIRHDSLERTPGVRMAVHQYHGCSIPIATLDVIQTPALRQIDVTLRAGLVPGHGVSEVRIRRHHAMSGAIVLHDPG
jgi:hypothetical protein